MQMNAEDAKKLTGVAQMDFPLNIWKTKIAPRIELWAKNGFNYTSSSFVCPWECRKALIDLIEKKGYEVTMSTWPLETISLDISW